MTLALIYDVAATAEQHRSAVTACKEQGRQLLVELRQRYHWNQQELAERLGRSRAYISRIHGGKVPLSTPLVYQLVELVRRLDEMAETEECHADNSA